jgi:diketogulonate reductase-like aldo/keto reductase
VSSLSSPSLTFFELSSSHHLDLSNNDNRFGLWKVTKSSCADTVYNAIKAGYRLLDGACDYGNEKEAGEGVTRAIKDGLVKREDLCECLS